MLVLDLQLSMEAAADRRCEVELLRQQLGQTEATLQMQRGMWDDVGCSGIMQSMVHC